MVLFIEGYSTPKNERTYFHVFPGWYFDDVFFIIYRFPTVCHFFVAFSQIKSSYPVVRGEPRSYGCTFPISHGEPRSQELSVPTTPLVSQHHFLLLRRWLLQEQQKHTKR